MKSEKPKFEFADDEIFLFSQEVAKKIRVNLEQPKNWRSLQKGPPFIKVEGTILYPVSWLKFWMADNDWLPAGWKWPEQPVRRVGTKATRLPGKKRVRA